MPDGYACITGCNPSIIKLKAVNGHPSPVDDGPREKMVVKLMCWVVLHVNQLPL